MCRDRRRRRGSRGRPNARAHGSRSHDSRGRSALYGTHTSSRNSEVIHAGIYYPPGSRKSRMCVEGRSLLYAYCEEKGIPHRRVGKLVVATNDEDVEAVRGYLRNAQANGVDDLRVARFGADTSIGAADPRRSGFFSPSTGIIDSHALMLRCWQMLKRPAPNWWSEPGSWGFHRDSGIRLRIGGADPIEIEAREVVNSAGLFAQRVAHSIAGIEPATIPPIYYLRGHYFEFAGASPFQHLVYPKGRRWWPRRSRDAGPRGTRAFRARRK
jgi:L-2-hydroxyglutarate oxidase LhgO